MEETVSHVVANYYALHIGIHRPFITSLRPSLTFDFHSLAICTNAARACVHLIDLSDRDEDCNAIGYEMQWSLFTATVVLVLNVWSGRKAGIPLSFSEDLRDVWKSLQFYQRLEERLVTYTIIRNVLLHLVSASDLPPLNVQNSRSAIAMLQSLLYPSKYLATLITLHHDRQQISSTCCRQEQICKTSP